MRRVRSLLFLFVLLPAAPARAGDGEVRLLTDDAIPRYLARGQELARAQQWDKVVDVLQRVVIGDQEVFPDLKPEVLHSAVYSEDGRLFFPARELCLKELARLPPEGLRAYRDAYDAAARDLFEAAQKVEDIEGRLAAYAEVYDKYLPSSVGDDALEAAADLDLSLGRYYEALALLRRLIDLYPKDTDRDLPMVYAKAAFCSARIGDAEHRDTLLDRLASEFPEARLRIQGELVAATALKDHPLMASRGGRGIERATDWPLAGGNPARTRRGEDLPEDFPRKPFWSYRLAERDPTLTAAHWDWLVVTHDREASPEWQLVGAPMLTPYPTVRPIVQGGLVLYKDYREIVARRVGSGTLKALVTRTRPPGAADDPSYFYPLKDVRPGADSLSKDARNLEAVYQFFDYGGNALVDAGEYLAAVESPTPPNELRNASPQIGRPNTLVVYSRRNGKLLWAWSRDYCSTEVRQDPEAYAAWQRDFESHPAPVFYGPGVIAGGILYTITAETDERGLSLWAVDAATGQVRFRTQLHYADEVQKLVPRGAAIAVAGGVVYAVTECGVVAAVDALPPGRVRWIARYDRNYEKGVTRRRQGFVRGIVNPGFAFNDPIVAGGKVIVAATDAQEIVALDAESGRLAWSVPKKALPGIQYVVGATDAVVPGEGSRGVLVLAGDKVLALDLAKGDRLWGPRALEGWPGGRGFLGDRYAYIPTKAENAPRSFLERFDLVTGGKAESLVFDVAQLGNVVSIDGRLIASNGAEVMCFTTYEAEVARLDKALATEPERAPLLLERALVALTADPKRREQARADFRHAIEAADAEGTDSAAMRAYALDNLFALARENLDLQALEEARTIVAPMAAHRAPGAGKYHPYEAQVALEEAELLGRLGRGAEALEKLEAFVDRYGHMRVVRENRVVDATAAATTLREHLKATNTAFKTAFEQSVRGRIAAAVAARDVEALQAIPGRYAFESPSEEAYFELASLHEETGAPERAEAVLREFLDKFPEHRRAATAHLLLARALAKQDRLDEARAEANEGISRLDEQARAENRDLLAELEKALAAKEAAAPLPRLRIPLAQVARLELEGFTPVRVEGALPEGWTILASAQEVAAVDAAGALQWRRANPCAATPVEPGPAGEVSTLALAAEVAAARFARVVGGDLIYGDVAGLMRIELAAGEVQWRSPNHPSRAVQEAQAALDLLRADLRLARTTGHVLRRHPLPSYVLSGNVVVRVHPVVGVEALHAGTGEFVWDDLEARGQVAVGPPCVRGEMIAVGWTQPGSVRIYDVRTGAHLNTFRRKGTIVVAPPVLDPLGRVAIISTADPNGDHGELGVFNVRGDEPALPTAYTVATSTAAVLYADGTTLVFHDGGSGNENLHFVDLEHNRRTSRKTGDLLRSYQVIRDGGRLFLFTTSPGLEDQGARLLRIDIHGADALEYEIPLKSEAFGPPLLTQRYVGIAAAGARGAHVRLFDREASAASRGPQPVFVTGDTESSDLDFPRLEGAQYGVAPALVAAGDGLVVGHPYGAFRLHAR